MSNLNCNFCNASLQYSFADLGMSPLSNSYVPADNLQSMEAFFPLHAYVCDKCFLVQLPPVEKPENIFSDYAYFSSFSDSWLAHCKKYVDMMVSRFSLNEKNQIVEIASNDGYLLQYFQQHNIPVLGVEPAANVAKVAEEKGVPSVVKFFGVQTAKELVAEGKKASVLLGNNVLAHVPDINDFVAGMKILLDDDGVITMEFPHLMQQMKYNQFDTIYHEHFSYLSFITVQTIFQKHGLRLFDVDEVSTHGGSLRIYACHQDDKSKTIQPVVADLLEREDNFGLKTIDAYTNFASQVNETKRGLLKFLVQAKEEGKTLVGYGAPAKGNTLLNYCGVRSDFLDYTVDRSPHKQGTYLPGVHIPIFAPEKIKETKPDYVVILPWNLRDEVMEQMKYVRDWGGKFVVFIPKVRVYE